MRTGERQPIGWVRDDSARRLRDLELQAQFIERRIMRVRYVEIQYDGPPQPMWGASNFDSLDYGLELDLDDTAPQEAGNGQTRPLGRHGAGGHSGPLGPSIDGRNRAARSRTGDLLVRHRSDPGRGGRQLLLERVAHHTGHLLSVLGAAQNAPRMSRG